MNTSGSKCSIPSFHIVWSTGVNIAASPKSRVVWKLRFSLRFPVQFLVSVKMTSQSKSVIFRSVGLYSGTSLLQIVVWLCLLSFYSIYKIETKMKRRKQHWYLLFIRYTKYFEIQLRSNYFYTKSSNTALKISHEYISTYVQVELCNNNNLSLQRSLYTNS